MSIPFRVDIFNVKNFITHTQKWNQFIKLRDEQSSQMRNAAIHPHPHAYCEWNANKIPIWIEFKFMMGSFDSSIKSEHSFDWVNVWSSNIFAPISSQHMKNMCVPRIYTPSFYALYKMIYDWMRIESREPRDREKPFLPNGNCLRFRFNRISMNIYKHTHKTHVHMATASIKFAN